MHKAHANRERDDSDKSQPILLEQLLRADEPAGHTKNDDNSCKDSAPPADEQRRLIVLEGAGGRRGRVERHGDHPGYTSAWRERKAAFRTMRCKERVLPGSIEGMPVFVGIQMTAAVPRPGRWHRLVACRVSGSCRLRQRRGGMPPVSTSPAVRNERRGASENERWRRSRSDLAGFDKSSRFVVEVVRTVGLERRRDTVGGICLTGKGITRQ